MESIVSKFNGENNLSYTFSSSAPSNGRLTEYGISTDGKYFYTDTTVDIRPFFWQISFPQRVTIDSYNICTKYMPWTSTYVENWDVSFSVDGNHFVTLQTDTANSATSDAVNYKLSRTISCKHFRITMKSTSNNNKWHAVSKFDCFESTELLPWCTRCIASNWRIQQLIISIMVASIIS